MKARGFNIRVTLWLNGDNGKESGNYYNGFFSCRREKPWAPTWSGFQQSMKAQIHARYRKAHKRAPQTNKKSTNPRTPQTLNAAP